jgi:hypothetical protein
MSVRGQFVIALTLAGFILLIFVCPVLNLPYTTLQGSQHGAVRIALLFALLQAWALATIFASLKIFHDWRQVAAFIQADSLLEITCTHRC